MTMDGADIGPRAVVSVFGSSETRPDDPDYALAVELGAELARRGLVVANGGYGGTMEAVSKGAASAGGTVIGVTCPPAFPQRPGPNPFVTVEVRAASITQRIARLLDLGDGYVALPGAIGTATEIMVAWYTNVVAARAGRPSAPLVLLGERWEDIVGRLAADLAAETPALAYAADVASALDLLLPAVRDRGREGR